LEKMTEGKDGRNTKNGDIVTWVAFERLLEPKIRKKVRRYEPQQTENAAFAENNCHNGEKKKKGSDSSARNSLGDSTLLKKVGPRNWVGRLGRGPQKKLCPP